MAILTNSLITWKKHTKGSEKKLFFAVWLDSSIRCRKKNKSKYDIGIIMYQLVEKAPVLFCR